MRLLLSSSKMKKKREKEKKITTKEFEKKMARNVRRLVYLEKNETTIDERARGWCKAKGTLFDILVEG